MEEKDQVASDVSPEEWVAEVLRLSKEPDESEIYVRVLFPGGEIVASGFRPLADAQTIQIPLQRQSPSGLGSAALRLSLPRLEEGWYRKALSETGEIFLSVAYPACGMTIPARVELQIATNLDFLDLVTNVAQMQ